MLSTGDRGEPRQDPSLPWRAEVSSSFRLYGQLWGEDAEVAPGSVRYGKASGGGHIETVFSF